MIGPLIGAYQVRRATLATLQLWLPSVLLEVHAEAAAFGGDPPPALKPVRTWRRLPNIAAAKDDQLPAVAVTSPGLIGQPIRHGDGTHTATWSVVAWVTARGKSYDETADLVGLYTVGLRTALLQHRSLDGFAAGLEWLGEDYDALDPDDARTLGAGFVEVAVKVSGVLDAAAGPVVPPGDPAAGEVTPPEPVIASAHVEVQPTEE